jgi:CheY-like chemotaxis protein
MWRECPLKTPGSGFPTRSVRGCSARSTGWEPRLGPWRARDWASRCRAVLHVPCTVKSVQLPCADPPPLDAPILSESSASDEPPGNTSNTPGRGVILYIDDTPSNLVLVERVLQRRPHVTLVTTGTGQDGIRLALERRPSLILLDLHLPDMNGEAVLQRLWESPVTRPIPVVILSADATPTTAEHLLAQGAVGYMPKPLDIHRLLRLVDEKLARTEPA